MKVRIVLATVTLAGAPLAHTESLEAPNAQRSQETSFVVQPSPKAIQDERLSILTRERESQVALLAAEKAAAVRAADRAESAARIRRVEEDLRALDAEIARVGKAPPAPLRNTSPSARPARTESAANAVANASTPVSEPVAFEGWDVFKNFGKQGATP